MKKLTAWLPEEPLHRRLAVALLLFLFVERLLLVLGQPDLLHDLDAGELKHMDLALRGLPDAPSLRESLLQYLSGPENIHHGGYPVVSALYAALSSVFGTSLTLLRLIPVTSTVLAAGLMAAWLRRRAGPSATLIALALMAGAPPLFLKWTCVSRGGHLEGIVFAPLMLVLLERGLRSESRWPWVLAGAAGGFAVYFTYLAAPLVVLLSLGAVAERWRQGGGPMRAASMALGAAVGFLPWIVGLLWLGMPYLDATIHQSGRPDEAAQMLSRGFGGTLAAAVQALPHNLWPWGLTEASAEAYRSDFSDMLDFTPTAVTWGLRGVILAGASLGVVAAVARRSPLAFAVAVLPAVHYLFVLRLAANLAWPDVPHRYFVLVFPELCASIGLGVAWLGSEGGDLRRGVAGVVAAALVAVGLQGVVMHASWLDVPDLSALGEWDVARYRDGRLGQVRVGDAADLNSLLDRRVQGEWRGEAERGVGQVFPAIADYYLLFREDPTPPYPERLLCQDEWQGTNEAQRRAIVEAAWDATLVWAGSAERAAELACTWDPAPGIVREALEVLATEGIDCPFGSWPEAQQQPSGPQDVESEVNE